MARINEHIQGWLMTEEGRAALEELRVSLGRMARRAAAASQDPDSVITNTNMQMVGRT
jgi:hypothetical protein